ncbi:MAG: pectate lyase [Prevotella sp.]|nr:pectate lyase [Prevotella sp.]
MTYSNCKIALRNLFLTLTLAVVGNMQASAEVTINEAGGWLETAWVEWANMGSAQAYNVYVSPAGQNSWTKLDNELVRNYGTYGRADAVGLKAGNYQLKVVPINSSGSEMTSEASTTESLDVRAHNRQGFAHMNRPTSGWTEGVGAYKNDGTLKDDAVVLYVTSKNAKNITVNWTRYEGKAPVTWTGLNNVIDGYRKCIDGGGMKKPLCIRIIGTVKYSDCDKMASSQGLHIKTQAQNDSNVDMPLTLEGVGKDATIYGFGMQISNAIGVEVRNLGIMLCLDDGIEISRYNTNIWIHNMDLFYGQTGGESDKVKGDGAVDTKDSRYCTISSNHYFDCGKCCLVDASDNRGTFYASSLTYCGNWFDHADQRLPRLRHGEAFHIYNNYYDGNGLYGVGLASASSAFVENNYFRNCRYPIVSSAQGSDLWHVAELKKAGTKSKGVMSGEEGGVCKAYNNHIEGAKSYFNQNTATTYGLDAYEVSSRSEQVPSTITATNGGSPYSNFDTNGELYDCTPIATEDVVAHVTGQYGAGRCQKGDFSWTFNNAVEDDNKEIITELKSALQSYKSSFVGFYTYPTAIENVGEKEIINNSATVKVMKNNRIIIEKAGKTFNFSGQRIK